MGCSLVLLHPMAKDNKATKNPIQSGLLMPEMLQEDLGSSTGKETQPTEPLSEDKV